MTLYIFDLSYLLTEGALIFISFKFCIKMAFVWIFLQELITGKGIFKGLEENDMFFIANAAAFGVCLVSLTAWLAIQGSEDYTKE
jgi:hypothetical protein